MRKYLTRVIKYYIFLLVLVTLVIILLALFKFADLTNIYTQFRNGYNAVWEIALIFLAVALIYPKIGFSNRNFTIRTTDADEANRIIFIAMGDRGYKLEAEEGNVLKFRKKWFMTRLSKFLEDRITIERISGFDDADSPEEQNIEENPTESSKIQNTEEVHTELSKARNLEEDNKEPSPVIRKFTVNIEGLTKDVLRTVSSLYGTQNRNTAE